jgi:hypothetical protein
MHFAELFLAAEPASIFYMITGIIGLLYARRRRTSARPSTAMLFCSRSAREKLDNIRLTAPTSAPSV